MTQLDNELEEASWAYYSHNNGEGSDAAEDDDAEGNGCLGIDDPVEWDTASPFQVSEDMPDLDELVEDLQGLPADDAVEEIRDALKKAGREASDADVLGVLLRVFRVARNNSVEGLDPWDSPIEYCEHLTKLCDRNFMTNRSPEDGNSKDLPASIVAAVYAECGRTMLLADELTKARDMLEKANNVFGVLPKENMGDLNQRQAAAARASYARVVRRLAGATESMAHYLRALQDFAVLDSHDDLADFLAEYCELLSDAAKDGEEPSPGTVSLLAEIAEEKFGAGSEEHLDILRQLADACTDANRTDLAAPALACRARLLRAMCTPGCGMWASAEAGAAEEEAAAACEAAVPRRLEEDDLDGAAAAWEEALHFREAVQGPDSQLVCEMRATLVALRQAIVARTAQGATCGPDENSNIVSEEPRVTLTSWDDEEVPAPAEAAQSSCADGEDSSPMADEAKSRRAVSATGGGDGRGAVPSGGLRPAWAKPSAAVGVSAAATAASAVQPSGDGWDD